MLSSLLIESVKSFLRKLRFKNLKYYQKKFPIFFSGDFLIRNETVESKFSIYHWPRVHRLEFKIENHDDLLSFAQIDIIDTDVSTFELDGMEKVSMSYFFRIHMKYISTHNPHTMKF